MFARVSYKGLFSMAGAFSVLAILMSGCADSTDTSSSRSVLVTAARSQATQSGTPVSLPTDLVALFPPASAVGQGFVTNGAPFSDVATDSQLVSLTYRNRANDQIVGIDIRFYPNAAQAKSAAEKVLGIAPLPTTGSLGQIGDGGALTTVVKVPAGLSSGGVIVRKVVMVRLFASGKGTDQQLTAETVLLARAEVFQLKSLGY